MSRAQQVATETPRESPSATSLTTHRDTEGRYADSGPATIGEPVTRDATKNCQRQGNPRPPSIEPFLYLPFRGDWLTDMTSVFDHSYPDYRKDGKVAAWFNTSLNNGADYARKEYGAYSCDLNSCGPGDSRPIAAYFSRLAEHHIWYDGHDGYDWKTNSDVLAAAPGLVTFVGWNGCLGFTIEIDHGNGYKTRYAHLVPNSNTVEENQWVSQPGIRIAQADTTGNSTGSHLHFSVFRYDASHQEWNVTDPFGWDVFSPQLSRDPLIDCNGETSINLWVGGSPRLPGDQPTHPIRSLPSNTQYVGGSPYLSPPPSSTSTDSATFLSDVTLPDGSVVPPGQALVKTWRVRNSGTSTWGPGYQLAFIGGDQMGAPNSVNLPRSVAPGEEVDISVNMTAPSTGGSYQGNWQMRNAQGVYFGDRMWVRISVPSGPTPTPPPSGGTEDITVQNVEYPSVVTPGQHFRPRITVRVNQGQLLQSRGDMLRNSDGNLYGALPHVAVMGTVNAGQTYTFEFYETNPITAPSDEDTYESKWRVWRDGNWAGPEITIRFDVRIGGGTRPNPPILVSPPNWYVSRDGSTPTLCASAPGGLQYFFQIYESHDNHDSGDWISSNCWPPPKLGPYGYQWHAKVRNPSNGLESDWSETWHFSIDSQQLTIDDLVFEPGSPSSADEVRVYTCVRGFGGIGLGLKIEANTATDCSASGQWQWIHHLGTFCYDRNNSNTWPRWWTLPLEDGCHLIRATGFHGDDTVVKEATYTLRRRRPNGPAHVNPSHDIWVNNRTVTFRWTPSPRVQNYRLIVATDQQRQNRVVDEMLPASATEHMITFTQDYELLYWWVDASNELGIESSGWRPFHIDRTLPASAISTLSETTSETSFVVQWTGSDDRSGIRWYDVQYRDAERGEWADWIANTTLTAAIFTGSAGHTYYFRVRALDNAGNLEPYPEGGGDTHTRVDLTAGPLAPWWNTAYSFKRNVVILNNDTQGLAQGYPIHLHFDSGTTPTASELYNASQSSIKGDDFRIIYNNRTELPRYIETFRRDRIDIWFNLQASIGSSPGSDSTSYQLYYSNPAASQPPGTINDVIPESSDGNTLGLWHFYEGSGSTVHDSSGNGRHGTAVNMGWTEGKFGAAGIFNGTNSFVNLGTSRTFNAQNITLEAWIKQTSQGWSPEWTILRKDADDNSLIYDFLTCGNRVYLRLNGNEGHVRSNSLLQKDRWYHVAGTYDGSTIKVYINGTLDNSASYNKPLRYGSSTTLYLGGDAKNNDKYFPGHIQNVRISNIARTSFPYGSYGNVINEPSSAVGDVIRPPISGSADLAVLSLAAYPNPTGGALVQAVVRNQGNAPTQNGFYTDLYANHLPTGVGDYTGSIRYWVASPIAAGQTITLTTVITDLSGAGSLGLQSIGSTGEVSGTLYVQADSTSAVSETDNVNNISAGTEVCIASGDAYEQDNTPATARFIAIGQTQRHNLHAPGDQDWVKFTAQAGGTYSIRTLNLDIAADTYLYLYDTDGTTLLAANDDYGGTLASEIEWTASVTGTYYLLVRHWNPNVSGCGTSYDVEVVTPIRRPDLRADPVLASPVKGACNVGVLYAGKTTYFDGGFTNIGGRTAAGTFQVELSVDGISQGRRDFSNIAAGARGTFADWAVTVQQSGTHTVTLKVDPSGNVAEPDEGNNIWQGQFTWEPVHGWWGEYFNNETLSGDPVFVRDDHELNFDWEAGSPHPCVNADHFSARWTRTLPFETGIYRFSVFRDDGARLRIDDALVLDKWRDGREWNTITHTLSAGNHIVQLQTFELGGWASARLSWQKITVPEPIPFGLVVPGEIRQPREAYTYTLRVNAPQWISARMVGSSGLDAYLELRDENGTLLMYNDDTWGLNSFFTYPLPKAGIYRIVARGYGTTTGQYRLRVDPGRAAHPADINADCIVDEADQTVLLGCWLSVVPPCDNADLNLDGSVNSGDLGILLANWRHTCPPAAVYMRSYPQLGRSGDPITITWTIVATGTVAHTDIHWGTEPGRLDRTGRAYSGNSGDYQDTLTVSGISTLYFAAHAQVGGNDYYSPEFRIPISPSALQQEAEDGTIEAPMVIGSDPGASNGRYVYSPVSHNGQVALRFFVPEEGDYQVWGRAWGDGYGGDSFTVRVDGGPLVTWDVPIEGWTWVPVTNRDQTGNALVQHYYLTGNTWHTVTVRAREAGARLDVVELRSTTPPQRACFGATPTSGRAPLTVQFTNCSTGTITSRLWEFGDGQTSAAINPTHTYTQTGTYTVTLTVTGPDSSHNLTRPNFITVTEPVTATTVVSIIPPACPAMSGYPLRCLWPSPT
ncbi:MAG: peptidoglycan DD-metalloendopeptidase family protein [Chloroflexi bacterium]|nr:peptidoglycan DD-metalloendopeptidase family protein [Chloroflexota bacterium]